MFQEEHDFIASLIAEFIHGSIEHVGSTSVSGLCAKPVIDIMVGVHSLQHAKAAIPILTDNGYCYHPYKGDVMHWFCKPSPEIRTHHLHLVPFESELWFERLAFRDYLRNNDATAKEYATLKHQLAQQSGRDREQYTQAKTAFVSKVLTLAKYSE